MKRKLLISLLLLFIAACGTTDVNIDADKSNDESSTSSTDTSEEGIKEDVEVQVVVKKVNGGVSNLVPSK